LVNVRWLLGNQYMGGVNDQNIVVTSRTAFQIYVSYREKCIPKISNMDL